MNIPTQETKAPEAKFPFALTGAGDSEMGKLVEENAKLLARQEQDRKFLSLANERHGEKLVVAEPASTLTRNI